MNYLKIVLIILQIIREEDNMIKEHLIKKYIKKANENMHLSRNRKAIKYLDKIVCFPCLVYQNCY